MTLVFLASYSGCLGGAERVGLDWLAGLHAEPILACPEGPLAVSARASGIRVLPLRARSPELRRSIGDRLLTPLRLLGHGHELHRLIEDLAPDLVLALGMRTAAALLLSSRRVAPIVAEHHDMLPPGGLGALARALLLRADLTVVPSAAVARDLRAGGSERVRVVHPGIDPERFAGMPSQPASQVLVLGAIEPWKRPDLALEAAALARAEGPHIRLRVVGSPRGEAGKRLQASLRRRAAQPDLNGAVELVAEVADARSELAACGCLLHCTPREPFGMVVLEALAAGRPVIVPGGAGPSEIVDATCALSYPAGDPAAAAAALGRLQREPGLAESLGEGGRLRVVEHFSLAGSQRAFAAAIGHLLPASGTPRQPAAPAAAAELALVTVTRNSARELERLLASAERHLPGAEVVVVDCDSSDDWMTVATQPREGIEVRTIPLDENVGFGRASNRGVASVSRGAVALVNPDVELIDASLADLAAECLAPGGRRRVLAPLVLSPDGRRQDTAHPLPASLPDLTRSLLPVAPIPRRWGSRLWPWRSARARRVGWAVACALVARTDLLCALGPFDERIFLYGEDLALGIDAARQGVETWFAPGARVLHEGGTSAAAEFAEEPLELLARARHEVVADRLGPARALLDDGAQALTFMLRLWTKRALGRPWRREALQLQALSRARSGWPRSPSRSSAPSRARRG